MHEYVEACTFPEEARRAGDQDAPVPETPDHRSRVHGFQDVRIDA